MSSLVKRQSNDKTIAYIFNGDGNSVPCQNRFQDLENVEEK